jgi:photosystem II stability/assembly factor-like uncharacterized protein
LAQRGFSPKPAFARIRICDFHDKRGAPVKHNIVIVAIVVIAVGLVILGVWLVGGQRIAGRVAVKDNGSGPVGEEARGSADLAEAGGPDESGRFPSDWGFKQRAYPYATIDYDQLTGAAARAAALRLEARKLAGPLGATWTEEGPRNIGARLTDLAMDPHNPDIIFAAMASGGVFKSSDGGTTWYPISDDLPVLTIGAIALDPADPDIIYAGTGEANVQSYSWFGMGLFKSTDGGATWAYMGLAETRYIARVVVDPLNTDRIWVAGTGSIFGTNPERGIYRSLDAGETWALVLSLTDSTAATDIAINPAKPDTVFAAMWERRRGLTYRRSGGPTSGIYRSYDGGDSWVELTSGLPSGNDVGRIGISVCASDPNVLYAIYDMWTSYEARVYKSINGGDSWTRTNDGAVSGVYSSYGWYFGQVRVDPGDPNRAFVLGVPMYRTENGGATWGQVGSSNHVDHHAMVFDPADHTRIFEGNDGGIYVSASSGTSWTKLYNQPTNQFYAIEIDYSNPQRLYGGTQDNGTLRTPTGADDDWEMIFGGDGFYCNVDPTDSDVLYVEYQYGNLYKSTDFGYSWDPATDGIDPYDRTNWSTPVVIDPGTPQTLYYCSQRVYRSTDGANSWSPISGDLTDGAHGGGYGTITTLAVSATDPGVIYVGTDDSNVWVTIDGGSNWIRVSGSLPNRWVTRVAIDPLDPGTAYVTFSGLRWDENIGYVYRTTDYGSTWSDITGDLPAAPVNALVVDPADPARLFVGSDVGCFYTEDYGASWNMLGTGLPAVPVYDLKLHSPTRILVAGTHGRSMYSFDLTALPGLASVETADLAGLTELSNSPNPFTGATTIRLSLPSATKIGLDVYDVAGRRVRSLVTGRLAAGPHEFVWDGRNDAGRPIASGIYFVRLVTPEGTATRTLNLVR